MLKGFATSEIVVLLLLHPSPMIFFDQGIFSPAVLVLYGGRCDQILFQATVCSSYIWDVRCSQCSDGLVAMCVGVEGDNYG